MNNGWIFIFGFFAGIAIAHLLDLAREKSYGIPVTDYGNGETDMDIVFTSEDEVFNDDEGQDF